MLTCGFSFCYFRGAVRVMQEMRSDSQFPDAVFSFILFVFFTDKTTIPNRKTHCCTRVPRIFSFIIFFSHTHTHTPYHHTQRAPCRARVYTVCIPCKVNIYTLQTNIYTLQTNKYIYPKTHKYIHPQTNVYPLATH